MKEPNKMTVEELVAQRQQAIEELKRRNVCDHGLKKSDWCPHCMTRGMSVAMPVPNLSWGLGNVATQDGDDPFEVEYEAMKELHDAAKEAVSLLPSGGEQDRLRTAIENFAETFELE